MIEHPREESDQLPEEGPPSQVPEDDPSGDREEVARPRQDEPGLGDEERSDPERATGNPENAG